MNSENSVALRRLLTIIFGLGLGFMLYGLFGCKVKGEGPPVPVDVGEASLGPKTVCRPVNYNAMSLEPNLKCIAVGWVWNCTTSGFRAACWHDHPIATEAGEAK